METEENCGKQKRWKKDTNGETRLWVAIFKRANSQADLTESKEKKYCPWEKNIISNIPAQSVSLYYYLIIFKLPLCNIKNIKHKI